MVSHRCKGRHRKTAVFRAAEAHAKADKAQAEADAHAFSRRQKIVLHVLCIGLNGALAIGCAIMGDHYFASMASTIAPGTTAMAVEIVDRTIRL